MTVIAAAQRPDGYLNSYVTVVKPDKRWHDLHWSHELYCAGHLIEAAKQAHITLQVLPFSSGEHAGMVRDVDDAEHADGRAQRTDHAGVDSRHGG